MSVSSSPCPARPDSSAGSVDDGPQSKSAGPSFVSTRRRRSPAAGRRSRDRGAALFRCSPRNVPCAYARAGADRLTSAASRSASRSSADSIPTERRTRFPGGANGASAVEACVIRAGCSIRLSTPPSDSASWKMRRARDEGDRFRLRLHQEGDHAAEVAHLPARDVVAGMVRQAGVEDALDAGMSVEELGDPPCVLAVLAHPHRERLDPAQDEPRSRTGPVPRRATSAGRRGAPRARRRSSRRSRRSRRCGRRGTWSSSARPRRRRGRAAAAGTALRTCCRRPGARRRRAPPLRPCGCRRCSASGSTASRPRRPSPRRRGATAGCRRTPLAGT